MNISDKIVVFLLSMAALIALFAAMISITIGYGFFTGSIVAVVLSLCSLFSISVFDKPLKCGICFFIKVIFGLSIINILTVSIFSDFFINYDSLKVTLGAFTPVLALVVVVLFSVYFLYIRFNGVPPKFVRLIMLPFMILLRPVRRIFFNVKSFSHAHSLLQRSYNTALRQYPSRKYPVNQFISMSKKIALKRQYENELAYCMALFTSGLLDKTFDIGDYEMSKKLFHNYAENLFPVVGGCGFRTNITKNALYLAMKTNDKDISDFIFNELLGKDFNIDDIKHDGVLFNLACYYSLHEKKDKMLEAIRLTLNLGRKKNDYLEDNDFEKYWGDDDFLKIISEGAS